MRNLEYLDALEKEGKNVKGLMAAAVTTVSDLFSSGGLVYGVRNDGNYGLGEYHKNFDGYIITESGNTESLPIDKIRKVMRNWEPVEGLKAYWLAGKEGKVSLLRRRDGKIIPVKNSNFSGNLGEAVYRNGYVYYTISLWVKDSNGYDYNFEKREEGFYKSSIYQFKVSAPTAQLLYNDKTYSAEFTLDNNSNMVLAPYKFGELGKDFQFFKAKADGKLDTANPIPLKNGTETIPSGGGRNGYSVINGPKGKIYVLHAGYPGSNS